MQTLDVVSINIIHIAISLCNLILLFCILKRFLYRPVMKVMAQRQREVDEVYEQAQEAEASAQRSRAHYESVMAGVNQEADAMLRQAQEQAQRRSDRIIGEAQSKSHEMLRTAQAEIDLEKKKMRDDMKQEMTDVTVLLAEKLLGREIGAEDQNALIESDLARLEVPDDGARE